MECQNHFPNIIHQIVLWPFLKKVKRDPISSLLFPPSSFQESKQTQKGENNKRNQFLLTLFFLRYATILLTFEGRERERGDVVMCQEPISRLSPLKRYFFHLCLSHQCFWTCRVQWVLTKKKKLAEYHFPFLF